LAKRNTTGLLRNRFAKAGIVIPYEVKTLLTLKAETSAKKREKNLRVIRHWLDATHFDHLKREKHWQDGTCEWIMEKPEFTGWLNGGTGPFWIYGIPGVYFSFTILDKRYLT